MQLELQNIGMIKEAKVNIDGLTVIAGENDTGKSTVGKALFMFLHNFNFVHKGLSSIKNSNDRSQIREHINTSYRIEALMEQSFLPELIFKNQITNAEFLLLDDNYTIHLYVDKNHQIQPKDHLNVPHSVEPLSPIIIETPLVWNFIKLVKDISLIESRMNIKLNYPYLMKELIFKMSIESSKRGINITKSISDLINGIFKEDEQGNFFFERNHKRIELENTATGIKTFGIFQVLSQNNWLNSDTVLILDEPEVHLHPKWQLKMAKVIVDLVQNGVKIIVNSHSPYMIEALQRYSEKANVPSDFYLAEDGYISKVENSNSQTLSKIFEKLS